MKPVLQDISFRFDKGYLVIDVTMGKRYVEEKIGMVGEDENDKVKIYPSTQSVWDKGDVYTTRIKLKKKGSL